eukprot:1005410-Pelagomonas_calceolata.AAC.1
MEERPLLRARAREEWSQRGTKSRWLGWSAQAPARLLPSEYSGTPCKHRTSCTRARPPGPAPDLPTPPAPT